MEKEKQGQNDCHCSGALTIDHILPISKGPMAPTSQVTPVIQNRPEGFSAGKKSEKRILQQEEGRMTKRRDRMGSRAL